MSAKTETAAAPLDQERRERYDNLTLAACVIDELGALFNALALMRGKAGGDGDIRRLIGIGQNISETWLTSFGDREAESLAARGLRQVGSPSPAPHNRPARVAGFLVSPSWDTGGTLRGTKQEKARARQRT